MIRTKVTCELCGQEISKSNYSKHLLRHQNNPQSFSDRVYKINHDGLNCQFCHKECKNKNSLCNHERLCKQNPNRQESKLASYHQTNNSVVWNKGLTKDTDPRVAAQSASLKEYYQNHDGIWKGKKHSQEEKDKIGEGVKQFLVEHPDMVPYLRNHSSKQSYPEAYFQELFENEKLPLIYHKQISTYQLDFCNEEKLIDIEIDGDQHYLDPKVIANDEKRTSYLKSLGWTIFRIRWSDYKKLTDAEKHSVILKIKQMLE